MNFETNPSADTVSGDAYDGAHPFGAENAQIASPANSPDRRLCAQRFEAVVGFPGPVLGVADASPLSLFHTAEEGFRRYFELGTHFVEDLVLARSPEEAIKLQLGFLSAQFAFFADQAGEMQREFTRVALTPLAPPENAPSKTLG